MSKFFDASTDEHAMPSNINYIINKLMSVILSYRQQLKSRVLQKYGSGIYQKCKYVLHVWKPSRLQWRIQDFSEEGAPTPKSAIILPFFAKNCMKMKEFGPPGGARP